MKKGIISVLSFVLMLSLAVAVSAETSPLENAGFETGDLTGWSRYCYGAYSTSASCRIWSATVGPAYAYDGNYGLRLYNANNYWWSGAVVNTQNRFNDDSDSYTIAMKLTGGRQYWSGVLIQIYDGSGGWVRYRGNSYGSINGAPPDAYFKMTQGAWEEYTFNFKQDFYSKYGRYPDSNRILYITSYQDSDYVDLYIDNVFGYQAPEELPCTDNDGDGYFADGGECGPADCNDEDASINPDAEDAACDGIDNNCNGEADEDYASVPTDCGVGACAASGETSCVDGNVVDLCSPGIPAPDDSLCDGIDNDCDAQTDEDYAPAQTICGIGECAASGELICVAGETQDTCIEGTPSEEACDNLDNDCDAVVDEEITQPTNELGACSINTETCSAGWWIPNNEYTPITEIVGNDADDDCDGTAVCDSSAYWKNHGQYVSCVARETGNENGEVPEAAQSETGKKSK